MTVSSFDLSIYAAKHHSTISPNAVGGQFPDSLNKAEGISKMASILFHHICSSPSLFARFPYLSHCGSYSILHHSHHDPPRIFSIAHVVGSAIFCRGREFVLVRFCKASLFIDVMPRHCKHSQLSCSVLIVRTPMPARPSFVNARHTRMT